MSNSLPLHYCSPPGSSVHWISQARILEWPVIYTSRGSSWPGDWTHISWVPHMWILYLWASWECKLIFCGGILGIMHGSDDILWSLSSSYARLLNCVQLFVTPKDCSPAGPSVHGISQARILEWVAIPFSRGSSQPRDWIQVSCIAGGFLTIWATREARNDQEGLWILI